MTIGERINFLAYEARKRIVVSYRLDASVGARKFKLRRRREVETSYTTSPGAEDVWSKDVLVPYNVPGTGKLGPTSLKLALQSNDQALSIIYNGRGIEAISVPFSNYLLLAGFGDESTFVQFSTTLKGLLEREHGHFLKDAAGLRTHCYYGEEMPEGDALLYTGYGVFVPGTDDEPVGTVAIVSAGENPRISIPRLPDGKAAGFYRGQSGLAFSASQQITPATVTGVPGDHVFFLGRFPGDEYSSGSAGRATNGLELVAERVKIAEENKTLDTGTSEAMEIRPGPEGVAQEGWDGAWQVDIGRLPAFSVFFAFDMRPSRLLKVRPANGPYFAIEGFAPGPFVNEFARFWLELTAKDGDKAILANSALSLPIISVIAEEGIQEYYAWSSSSFGERQSATKIYVGDTKHDAIFNTSLGFLGVPEPGEKIAFSNPRNNDGDRPTFDLDWLDHACKIEFQTDEVVGLAQALAEVKATYLVYDEGKNRMISSSGKPLLVFDDDDKTCMPVNPVALDAGKKFILGGVILRYHSGK